MGEYLAKKLIHEKIDIAKIDAIVPFRHKSSGSIYGFQVLNIPYVKLLLKIDMLTNVLLLWIIKQKEKNISRKLSITKELS